MVFNISLHLRPSSHFTLISHSATPCRPQLLTLKIPHVPTAAKPNQMTQNSKDAQLAKW